MIKNQCVCCSSLNLTIIKKTSFFNFPVLQCIDCGYSKTQIDKDFDLKKYYDKVYWSTFRNIEKKQVNEDETDSGYFLKKLPKPLQYIIELTGVRKAQAFSQFNYVFSYIKGKKILEIGSGEGFLL